jgi:hypothetical protein
MGHRYAHGWRGYGWRGATVAGGGSYYSGGYAYPYYAGGVGYGYRHHGCWWYRHYEPYNIPSWCATYVGYGPSYGYSYGVVAPAYSYGYGHYYRTHGGYHRHYVWNGGYHSHFAWNGGWRRSVHFAGVRPHGVVVAHGGAHFAPMGGHARFAGMGGHMHGHFLH